MATIIRLFANVTKEKGSQLPPRQLDLFPNEASISGVVAYVDTEKCDQEELLRTIALNSAKVVLDIRRSAAFPKPRFRHKEVADYFEKYGVRYRDLYEEMDQLATTSVVLFSNALQAEQKEKIKTLMHSGPCVVVFDSSDGVERINMFRSLISSFCPMLVISGSHHAVEV